MITKFESRSYVADIYRQKIGLNPCRGFFSPNTWNMHPKTFECLLHVFFLVLPLAYRRDRWTDFDAQYVVQRGSAQGSAFWGLEYLNLMLNLFIRKIQKIQWRLWGKFKNSSNRHNFGCIQHQVVFLVPGYGFRGRPIQRCHLDLPRTDPCGHGIPIWAK